MDEHIGDLLPFYINETLPMEQRDSVKAHLSVCPKCQDALREWEGLAFGIRSNVPSLHRAGIAGSPLSQEFPPLSPVVRANLRRRPSLPEAVLATASLIHAQRVYLKESWLIQTVSAMLLIAVLATLFLPPGSQLWAAIPFFLLVPFFAIVSIGFFETQEDDLGYEIVAATPTHPGTLIFARLTLALGIIAALALFGSFLISGLGSISLVRLVATWLGPMLWLSALTTLLALLWRPWIATAISITLWGGIALLLVSEGYGKSLLGFSLAPLLYPSWISFMGQVLLAGFLWLSCWLWVLRGTPPALRLERGG